jgi:hypothetical protein
VTEAEGDLGEYCRRVEEHLARVNEGEIVRVVGPAFEIVRQWALDGIPLSVAFHGIDRKAERHRAGQSRRPLRLEFCEADVRETFDRWRRAVGVAIQGAEADPAGEPRRRPSLAKHLDRAVERLSRVVGRLDLPEDFRDRLSASLVELAALREAARTARGDARAAIAARLPELDRAMLASARSALPAATLDRLRADASADLSPYQGRLAPEVWRRSLDRGADERLREHLGLPTIGFDG